MRNDFVTQALRCGDCLLHSITSSTLTDTRAALTPTAPHSHWSVVCVMTAKVSPFPGAPATCSGCPAALFITNHRNSLWAAPPCIWWSLGMALPVICTTADRHPAPCSTPLQVASAHLHSTSLRLPAPQCVASPQCGHGPFCNDPKESQDGAVRAHVI